MTAFSLGLRRAVALGIALVALVGGLFASAAHAAPYTPNGRADISTSAPAPGGSIEVTGGGFKAGSTVQVVIYSDPVNLGSARANAAGEVSLDVTIPASFAPGSQHTIQLQGIDPSGAVRVLSHEVTIADSEGQLAYTGATVLPLIGGGVVLLGLGAFLLVRTRRGATAR